MATYVFLIPGHLIPEFLDELLKFGSILQKLKVLNLYLKQQLLFWILFFFSRLIIGIHIFKHIFRSWKLKAFHNLAMI